MENASALAGFSSHGIATSPVRAFLGGDSREGGTHFVGFTLVDYVNTLLSCCVTRINVVRFAISFNCEAPT